MPLYAEAWPGSHQLEKAPGDLITAEWIVFNDGPEAFARLELHNLPVVNNLLGPHFAVPAGTPEAPGQKQLAIIHTLLPPVEAGTRTVILQMREVAGLLPTAEAIRQVATHSWGLTVTGGGGGGAVIVAVGEPIIS